MAVESEGGGVIVYAIALRRSGQELQALLLKSEDGALWSFPAGVAADREQAASVALVALAEKAGYEGTAAAAPAAFAVEPYSREELIAVLITDARRQGNRNPRLWRFPGWYLVPTALSLLSLNRLPEAAERMHFLLLEASHAFRDQEGQRTSIS